MYYAQTGLRCPRTVLLIDSLGHLRGQPALSIVVGNSKLTDRDLDRLVGARGLDGAEPLALFSDKENARR
jgi:hypothetical protein